MTEMIKWITNKFWEWRINKAYRKFEEYRKLYGMTNLRKKPINPNNLYLIPFLEQNRKTRRVCELMVRHAFCTENAINSLMEDIDDLDFVYQLLIKDLEIEY